MTKEYCRKCAYIKRDCDCELEGEIGTKGEVLARLDLIRKLDRTDDPEAHFFDGDGHTMTMSRKDYDSFRLWLTK